MSAHGAKAWLLMGHNTKTGAVRYDLFSERHPTGRLDVITAEVACGTGSDYQAAIKDLRREIQSLGLAPHLEPLLSVYARRSLDLGYA